MSCRFGMAMAEYTRFFRLYRLFYCHLLLYVGLIDMLFMLFVWLRTVLARIKRMAIT